MKHYYYNKLFRIVPKLKSFWYKRWNPWKMRKIGVALGKAPSVLNKLYIYVGEGAIVKIGSHFAMTSDDNLNPLFANRRASVYVVGGAKLRIGDWVGISGGSIWCTDSITIGNHVNIGAGCVLMDGDIHNENWQLRHTDRQTTSHVPYSHRPIVIGDDVWLGTGVIVLKGVSIGPRSIIGAGSVVTKSIPADCVAAGNPCKVIRNLV